MMTKVRNFLRFFSGQDHTSTRSLLPKLSGAELARSSWAVPIASFAEVPAVYKRFFEDILRDARAFPYTVLTPSHERFITRQSEKLISDLGHEIYILEKTGSTFTTQCYPVDDIRYVEFRTALLASSLKICGLTGDGVFTSSTLIFNSVTDYLFAPLLKTMRSRILDSNLESDSSEGEHFNHLRRVNYKFMNYARHSLFGGEKVTCSVFQPEILKERFVVLGKIYYRTISPTHMILLTDSELILIREDNVRRKEDRYGGIWTYIPLNKVVSLSANETADHLLGLAIQLPEEIRFEVLFQPSAKPEIDELIKRFGELNVREGLSSAYPA